MDILGRLQKSQSKPNTDAIVKEVGSDAKKYALLVKLTAGNDARISQCAAWPLGDAGVLHPELAQPHLKQFISLLQEKNRHPAVHRNILRVLEQVDIPESQQAVLLDLCFGFIRNQSLPEAIRAFAITVATNICKPYPELATELILLIKELLTLEQKPAVMVRIKRALKELRSADSKL